MENRVIDFDNNSYKTALIGDQVWMAENLKVIHYQDGTPVPLIKEENRWGGTTEGAYTLPDEQPIDFKKNYGVLYNYYAVSDKRGLCPVGWHIPSKKEWDRLIEFLGGYQTAGSVMKDYDSGLWMLDSPEKGDLVSFSALPAGGRGRKGGVEEIGKYATWWSSSEENSEFAWHYGLFPERDGIRFNPGHKNSGFSVRCLQNK